MKISNRWKLLLFLTLISSTYAFSQELRWSNIDIKANASFRGLTVVDNLAVWASGSKGWIGRSTDGAQSWNFTQVKNYEMLDFRTIYAFDSLTAIIANAGSPSYIFRTADGGQNWNIVYQNDHKEAFIDGVDFWNKNEGMIYGDPIGGRMLLIHTKDGGRTWKEIPEKFCPQLKPGEASFAASGTGVRCAGNKRLIIATGGMISRLWISENKGMQWDFLETPIIQGIETTGIFSVVFWNKQKGVIAGGDYKRDTLKKNHIFYTLNSGKTWLPPKIPTRGLMECVEYLSEFLIVATGPQGIDISYDGGQSWKSLSDEKLFHVIRKARKGSLIVAAGNGKIGVVN